MLNASPLKPNVSNVLKSLYDSILVEENLWHSFSKVFLFMPTPSSLTSISSSPPFNSLIFIFVALASMLFSISSLTIVDK